VATPTSCGWTPASTPNSADLADSWGATDSTTRPGTHPEIPRHAAADQLTVPEYPWLTVVCFAQEGGDAGLPGRRAPSSEKACQPWTAEGPAYDVEWAAATKGFIETSQICRLSRL
jgi:hypothetical protein